MNMMVSTMNGSTMKAYGEALARKARTISSGGDFKDLLKIAKDSGAITFGQENVELHDDDVIAVNPTTIRHGFVAFNRGDIATTVDGETAEVSVPIMDDLPDYDELPELEQPKGKKNTPIEWKPFLSIEGKIISGPNEGLEFSYKPTSFGGHKAIKFLLEEISKRMTAGDSACIPVCLFSSDSYYNKTWSKDIHFLVIDIESWMTFDEAEETPVKGAKKKSKAEVPVKGAKKLVKAQEPDEDDEDEEEEKPARGKGRPAKASLLKDKKNVKAPEPQEDDEDEEDEEEEKPARGIGRPAKTPAKSFLKNRPAPQEDDEDEEDEEDDTDAQYNKRKARVAPSRRK